MVAEIDISSLNEKTDTRSMISRNMVGLLFKRTAIFLIPIIISILIVTFVTADSGCDGGPWGPGSQGKLIDDGCNS